MGSFLLLVRETVPGRGQEPGSGRAEHPGVWAQWAAGTRRPRGGGGRGLAPPGPTRSQTRIPSGLALSIFFKKKIQSSKVRIK